MNTTRKQLFARITSPRIGLSLSFDEVAQASHVAIAAAVVALASARFLGNDMAKYAGAILIVAFAAVKEFYFDHKYEDPVTRGSDLEDFLYYVVGAIAALLILWGN